MIVCDNEEGGRSTWNGMPPLLFRLSLSSDG